MVTVQTVMERLTGKTIVDALVEMMKACFEDFAEVQCRYDAAMHKLGEGEAPVAEEMEAIWQQTASTLLFSGWLGIKANLDHFIDPVAKDLLDVDFEVFLREDMACRLPAYGRAQKVRDRFFASLSAEQWEIYEDVTGYVSYLETVGPKLAHYFGYLLGNELLYRVVPGYRPDLEQTKRYGRMLESYFGVRIPADR